MSAQAITIQRPAVRSGKIFQPQDLAWLLFVAVLILTTPETNYNATLVFIVLGVFQVVERRMQFFASRRGHIVSVAVTVILSYLLVGWTHGIDSYCWPIFLVPIVTAATEFQLPGVIATVATACLGMFSFLLPVFFPYNRLQLEPEYLSLLFFRVWFYVIIAFVLYEQASARRDQMNRTREAAEQLAESNRSLRVAEASLRRTERLAALGQLTAGLAHELRNPLGTIKASAEMLTKQSTRSRPEVMAEMAEFIGSEVDRMNGLIASFLDFAKPLQVRAAPADLRLAIADVVRQHEQLAAGRQVHVSVHVDDTAASFAFDPDLLKVALSNLVQNAIQASSAGQTVEIRATASGPNVMIFVTDQGEGIQPQHLENIFNPFFTTKPEGVGLGLAIVAKIVDEHHGRINVFSEPGRGARFEITLPRNWDA